MVKKHKWIFLLPFIVVLVDQASKYLASENIMPGERLVILKNLLYFTNTSNTGTLFGLFQGTNVVFIIISLIALYFISYYFLKTEDRRLELILALVSGAAIGNLIDRILFGHVVDFIKIEFYPAVFNIADSVITVCIIWLLVYLVMDYKKENKINKGKKKK
ncbi:signal peptidase II [Candidatus Woesearchaeota archaeon]|nr:signal peptidase II [Candidatus Woesearchaeota archaeon]